MGGIWSVSTCLDDFSLNIGLMLTDPNTHDAMHVLDEEEFVASAVVYPGSTEEVQKIVLWANKYKIPIFPISIGRNRKSLSVSELIFISKLILYQSDTVVPHLAFEDQ